MSIARDLLAALHTALASAVDRAVAGMTFPGTYVLVLLGAAVLTTAIVLTVLDDTPVQAKPTDTGGLR